MALRRGFKAAANDIAREVRIELGLNPFARLDPWQLAEHLDVPVVAMTELGDVAPAAVRYFSQSDTSSFSAVTVFRDSHRMIVHKIPTYRVGKLAT